MKGGNYIKAMEEILAHKEALEKKRIEKKRS
jgi:hypothetical protein